MAFTPKLVNVDLGLLWNGKHADIVGVLKSLFASTTSPSRDVAFSSIVHSIESLLHTTTEATTAWPSPVHAHLEVTGFKYALLNKLDYVDGVLSSYNGS